MCACIAVSTRTCNNVRILRNLPGHVHSTREYTRAPRIGAPAQICASARICMAYRERAHITSPCMPAHTYTVTRICTSACAYRPRARLLPHIYFARMFRTVYACAQTREPSFILTHLLPPTSHYCNSYLGSLLFCYGVLASLNVLYYLNFVELVQHFYC